MRKTVILTLLTVMAINAAAESSDSLQTTVGKKQMTIEQTDKKKHDDCDTTSSNWKFLVGGVYVGWGHSSAATPFNDMTGTNFEAGILNAVGVRYYFGDRNRLSLGIGYGYRHIKLKSDYSFDTADDGNLTIVPFPDGYKKTSSGIKCHSWQFPLLYGKGIGKNVWLFAGGVMNWNFYASYDRNFKIENTKYNETTNHLDQRKISFDLFAGVMWKGIGVYFRYCPQSVFKDDTAPKINKTWNLGLSLGF